VTAGRQALAAPDRRRAPGSRRCRRYNTHSSVLHRRLLSVATRGVWKQDMYFCSVRDGFVAVLVAQWR